MTTLAVPTGVILAGGLGTRLKSAVPDYAKSVVTVKGRPFLTYLLEQLHVSGVSRVILCTGYKADQVSAEIGSRFGAMEILYSAEETPLGTGGAIRLAWHRYGEANGAGWITMNGDSYCNIGIADLWKDHVTSSLPATITAVSVPDAGRFGSLVWKDRGIDNIPRLEGFAEKTGENVPGWINAGIYALSPGFLETLISEAVQGPLSLEREVFPAWIPRGIGVFARRARFIDIGTPESYLAAQTFFGEVHQ